MTDKIAIIGVDGGASKVNAHLIKYDGEYFSLENSKYTKEYKNYADFRLNFKPINLATQLQQINENSIELTGAEIIQSNAYYAAFIDVIKGIVSTEKVIIGIGMPGIKSADGRGIIAMANGPRMPHFASIIEKLLTADGIALAKPIVKIGSDADYCGVGEEFTHKGLFRGVQNAYYLGGGTGVADAMKLNGKLLSFDSCNSWIAKTWEFNSGDGNSMEKYCSANGIQEIYGKKEKFNRTEMSSLKAYIIAILGEAYDGNKNAIDTWKIATKNIAELLFERICTIYSGWQNNFEFINPGRGKLATNHDFKGSLLDKIVIGQRLGDTIRMKVAESIITQPILNYLSQLINDSASLDSAAKSHYLKNGKFKRKIFTTSKLREAPALGAGIDAFKSYIQE